MVGNGPQKADGEVVEQSVEFVTQTVRIPKELQDVRVFMVELIRDIKAGKSSSELASENLGNLMGAIAGADRIGAEAGTPEAITFGALLGADVTIILMGKTE